MGDVRFIGMGSEFSAALEADDAKLEALGAYERSVGDVEAPAFVDNQQATSDQVNDMLRRARLRGADETRADAELVEKLATDRERAAVVKFLLSLPTQTSSLAGGPESLWRALRLVAADIEKGEHR